MKMMKSSIFLIIMVLAFSHAIAINTNEEVEISSINGDDSSSSQRSKNRFLGQYNPNPRASMTCDIFPRICRAKGSPGPDCCKKQCVNVMSDSLNCGMCGRRCRYGEACCGGECVNVMYDPRNCGGCKNRCKKGSFCKYGMCSYA